MTVRRLDSSSSFSFLFLPTNLSLVRLGCDAPPICIPVDEYSVGNYLNNPEIQALLGIGKYQEYISINFNLNFNWSTRPEIMLPTTREVSYLVDVAKVRFLVLNGNYDIIM
jgi:hypothetical protein